MDLNQTDISREMLRWKEVSNSFRGDSIEGEIVE